MGTINIGRVIICGIVAGIVGNILGFLADGVIFASQWAAGMKALGRGEFTLSQNLTFSFIGLVQGIFVVWLYAAMRPRFGAGPKTAVYAGLAAWAIGALLPNASLMGVSGLFPANLTVMTTAAAIVETVVAALAGGALYKEESAGTPQSRAAHP